MIISNAVIGMAAQREYRKEHSISEQLEFWSAPTIDIPRETTWAELVEPPKPEVDLSRSGSLLALYRTAQNLDLEAPMDARSRLNLMIIESMYKAITGETLKVTVFGENGERRSGVISLSMESPPPAQVAQVRSSEGAGLVYQRQERYQEQESLRFQAVGLVHTADGRALDFSVAMSMSREFVQESGLNLQAGSKKIDPLVINFDGQGAALTQRRFEFDLDNNGTADQIARLDPGSGYLALDRNGDGVINNGSELFGPNSGRGFEELAAFDEDGNHFIDEADSVYHQLRIWITHEDGSSQLAALGDKNVGAIFLGHVSSPFQLKDANNNSLGEVVNSGVYLTEDGKAGVVQEINLSV